MKQLALACALLFAACDDSSDPDAGGGDDAGGADAGMIDGGITDGGMTDAGMTDAGMTDAGMPGACGSARPTITGITGTEGLVIARDGTIYYTRSGGVGRMLPGGTPQNGFVAIGGTLWGLALDAANETLYVAVPGTGVRRIDLTAATPTAAAYVNGGAPNGMTIGPDGFLYYSDFSAGRVYRVDPDDGSMRTEVTASTIAQANGVAFEAAGTLLVASYATGVLHRLTLDASGSETARATVTSDLGAPDGVAVAADGTIYVGDQGGPAGVYRVSGGTATSVRTGLAAPASVEFGAGDLRCEDLYVAVGGGALVRIDDVGPGAAVPWH